MNGKTTYNLNYRDWNQFNDNSNSDGVEGYYTDDLIKGYRIIFIDSTNSKRDWINNIFGWRLRLNRKPLIYNKPWETDAKWVRNNLMTNIDLKYLLIGYSCGYAVALTIITIMDGMGKCEGVLGIAGSSPHIGGHTSEIDRYIVWKKGDIIPHIPFSNPNKTNHDIYPKVSSWFWNNHYWGTSQINEEIKCFLNRQVSRIVREKKKK